MNKFERIAKYLTCLEEVYGEGFEKYMDKFIKDYEKDNLIKEEKVDYSSVADFVDNKIVLSLGSKVSKELLYDYYLKFCEKNKFIPEDRNKLYRIMKLNRYNEKRFKFKDELGNWKNTKAYYCNIFIKED